MAATGGGIGASNTGPAASSFTGATGASFAAVVAGGAAGLSKAAWVATTGGCAAAGMRLGRLVVGYTGLIGISAEAGNEKTSPAASAAAAISTAIRLFIVPPPSGEPQGQGWLPGLSSAALSRVHRKERPQPAGQIVPQSGVYSISHDPQHPETPLLQDEEVEAAHA